MGRRPRTATENPILAGPSEAPQQIVQQATSPPISHSFKRMLIAVDRNSFSVERLRELLHKTGLKHDTTLRLLYPLGDPDNNYGSAPYTHDLYTDKHFHFDKDGDSLMDIIFCQDQIFFVIYSKVLARHLAKELGLENQIQPGK